MKPFSLKRLVAYCYTLYVHNAAFLTSLLVVLWAFMLGTQFLAYVLHVQVSFWAGMVMMLAGWVFSVLLGMGMLWSTIQIVRHQHVAHEDILTPAPRIVAYVVAHLLYHLMVAAGLVLFIVPGLVWAVMGMFYRHLILDKGVGPVAALRLSARITKGARLRLLGLALFASLLNVLGVLMFIVGLLVTVPLTMLMFSRVYDRQLALYCHSYAKVPVAV